MIGQGVWRSTQPLQMYYGSLSEFGKKVKVGNKVQFGNKITS